MPRSRTNRASMGGVGGGGAGRLAGSSDDRGRVRLGKVVARWRRCGVGRVCGWPDPDGIGRGGRSDRGREGIVGEEWGSGVRGLGFGRLRGRRLGRPGLPSGQLGRGPAGGGSFPFFMFCFLFCFSYLYITVLILVSPYLSFINYKSSPYFSVNK